MAPKHTPNHCGWSNGSYGATRFVQDPCLSELIYKLGADSPLALVAREHQPLASALPSPWLSHGSTPLMLDDVADCDNLLAVEREAA